MSVLTNDPLSSIRGQLHSTDTLPSATQAVQLLSCGSKLASTPPSNVKGSWGSLNVGRAYSLKKSGERGLGRCLPCTEHSFIIIN